MEERLFSVKVVKWSMDLFFAVLTPLPDFARKNTGAQSSLSPPLTGKGERVAEGRVRGLGQGQHAYAICSRSATALSIEISASLRPIGRLELPIGAISFLSSMSVARK